MAQPLGARMLGPNATVLGTYQWALAHPLGAPKPCCLKENRWAWQHMWACGACLRGHPMLSPWATERAAHLSEPSPADLPDCGSHKTPSSELSELALLSHAFILVHFFFFSFGAWINTKCKTVQTAFRCKTKRVMCHASYALSSHWIRLEATVNVNFKWKYITFAEKPTGFFWTAQKPGWRASRWKRQAVGGWKRGPAFALKETLGGGEGRALSAQLSLEDCCQDISFVFHYLYFLII